MRVRSELVFRGAHAPSRAGDDALVIADFPSQATRATATPCKFVSAWRRNQHARRPHSGGQAVRSPDAKTRIRRQEGGAQTKAPARRHEIVRDGLFQLLRGYSPGVGLAVDRGTSSPCSFTRSIVPSPPVMSVSVHKGPGFERVTLAHD